MESDVQDSRLGTLTGRRRVKRKIRQGIEIALPILGMAIIFTSVLFGPNSLQAQVLLVLIGVLILEAGVWGLTGGILPNERRYLGLREEGDHFLGLIRVLNAAALARDKGEEDDARFRDARAQMHTSVDRMAELAGQDDVAEAEEAEALAADAEAVAAEAEAEVEAGMEAVEVEAGVDELEEEVGVEELEEEAGVEEVEAEAEVEEAGSGSRSGRGGSGSRSGRAGRSGSRNREDTRGACPRARSGEARGLGEEGW